MDTCRKEVPMPMKVVKRLERKGKQAPKVVTVRAHKRSLPEPIMPKKR